VREQGNRYSRSQAEERKGKEEGGKREREKGKGKVESGSLTSLFSSFFFQKISIPSPKKKQVEVEYFCF